MNRPNKNKYINKEFDGAYVIELEKFCDELERKLSGHDILVKYADDLLADNKELNKALDKTCNILCYLDCYECQIICKIDCKKMRKGKGNCTSQDWKEWALSDE